MMQRQKRWNTRECWAPRQPLPRFSPSAILAAPDARKGAETGLLSHRVPIELNAGGFFLRRVRNGCLDFSLYLALIVMMLTSPCRLLAADDVVVAVVGPMVGTSNSVGIQYSVGVRAALKDINGNTLLGHKVNIDLFDDSCTKSIAEGVAMKLAENPPSVVIGHSCSGATIISAPIYAKHKILQITPASTNPKVTEMGISTLFRMIGRDDLQGKMAAQRISERHAGQRVGVLFFPSEYSEGLTQTAIAALEQRGITPVARVQASPSASSYAKEIAALMQQNVEVLYLVGGGLDCGIFLRQARQMEATFAVISSDTLVSGVFLQTAGQAAEGVPFTFPPEATQLPTAASAIETIRAMGQEPVGYTLLAYAATQVWIEGVMRAKSFDAEQIAAAVRSEPVLTILGEVTFDGKGDIRTAYPAFAWHSWKDGKRAPLD